MTMIVFSQLPVNGWPSASHSNLDVTAVQPVPCPPCVVPVEM